MFISVLRHQIQKRDGTEIWVQKLKLFSSYEMTTWDGSAEYPILSFSSAFGVTEDKKKYTNNKRCYQMFSMELQNRQEWLREKSTTGKHPKSKNKCIERNFTNAFPSKIKQQPMQCERTERTAEDMKRHVQRVHEGILYPCDQCCHVSKTKGYLGFHVKSQHSCSEEYCSNETYNKNTLKSHFDTEHGIVKYKCEIMNCNCLSAWKRSLRAHNLTRARVQMM